MQKSLCKRSLTKSIKARLVGYFMLVILISVFAFEALLIYFTRYYFYNNVEGILTNQIKISTDFYSRYFSNVTLEENVLDNVDIFWKQTTAEVQIIDTSGRMLMDSIGYVSKSNVETSDFKEALKGEKGKWLGRNSNNDKVMAISYPLKSGDKIVGVLRFVASLKEEDATINRICIIFISIGFTVIFFAGLVSLVLSRSIVYPLNEVTKAAEKMAEGDFQVRINGTQDDEIGTLADTLNYMAGEVQKKDQIKNEFISSISHELRTPLTSIKGWAITLSTDDLQDKAILKDGLKIIESESERLTAMVEELLDFSRFISGKVKLDLEEGNICEVVKYIEKYMSPRASRENLQFTVHCEPEIPVITMDKDRVKQVLINLLDNSFKFTPSGGSISLSASSEDGWVTLCVRDNGSGIDEEDLPRVKEKFYRGKNSKAHCGLGLSICDEIVTMHGGGLIIESQLNIGTVVTVKLPI